MNLVLVCVLRRIPNGVLRQVPVYGQKIFDTCTRKYGSQGNSFGKTMYCGIQQIGNPVCDY